MVVAGGVRFNEEQELHVFKDDVIMTGPDGKWVELKARLGGRRAF